MEPITFGAIALLTLIGNKVVDWSTEKALDAGLDKVKQVLKDKSPETAAALETAAAQAALPPGEREDIGEAVLVEQVKKAAEADPEIKEAVEALGNQASTAAQANPELAKAIAELTAAIKAQSPTTVENWHIYRFCWRDFCSLLINQIEQFNKIDYVIIFYLYKYCCDVQFLQ